MLNDVSGLDSLNDRKTFYTGHLLRFGPKDRSGL
jgi:hypothetical protein